MEGRPLRRPFPFSEDLLPQYDAILIPGGGVREGGVLPPWVRIRLDRAAARWSGEFLVALSAGTPHRPPPPSPTGYPVFESRAAAAYLVAKGLPPERVLAECHSYDTIGNAYFARTTHADPAGWRRLLVVTSEFHAARAQAVFEWVFGLDPPGEPYRLDFESCPNAGLDAAALQLRVEKERRRFAELPALTGRLTTLRRLHEWLFTTHGAYSTEGYETTYRPLDGLCAETY